MGWTYDVGSGPAYPDRAPANRQRFSLIVLVVILLVVCVGAGVGLGVYFGACTKSCDDKAHAAGGEEDVNDPYIPSTQHTMAASLSTVPTIQTHGSSASSGYNSPTTPSTISTTTVVQTAESITTSSVPKPPTEGGVYFSPYQMARMVFDDGEFPAKGLKYFRVGFQSKKKQGILAQIRDASNQDYVSLEMKNNGGVKFIMDVNFMRFALNTGINNIDYADGLTHEVIVRRSDDGRNLTIEISTEGADANRTKTDELATAFSTFPGYAMNLTLNNPKVIFIGNNDTSIVQHGFDGCILRMQIDNFYPLKIVFQDPKPTSIIDFGVSPWLQPNTCECDVFIPVLSQDPDQVLQKPSYNTQPIPLILRPDMMVRYSVNRTLKCFTNSFNNLVTVEFITDVSHGTLVQIGGSDDSHLSLNINNKGTVTLSFNDGSYDFGLDSSAVVNVADGRLHTLSLFRYAGQSQIVLQIDSERVYGTLDYRIQTWLKKTNSHLYVGNTESNGAAGFDGCISWLMIGNPGCYPPDAFEFVGGVFDEDLMLNETASTDYLRSICGMTNLANLTVTQAR